MCVHMTTFGWKCDLIFSDIIKTLKSVRNHVPLLYTIICLFEPDLKDRIAKFQNSDFIIIHCLNRDGTNVYPQFMFLSNNKKSTFFFSFKNYLFFAFKIAAYCICMYA